MLGLGLSIPKRAAILGGAGNLTGGISFAAGYPLDSATGTTTFAVGVGALTATWKTGPLFDLVAGDVTTTIHGVGPGYPDVRAIAAACGIDPRGSIGGGHISNWYDQSGSGNNLIVYPGATPPSLWLIFGKVYVFFGGALNINAGVAATVLTASASINSQSFTFFSALTSYSTTASAVPGKGGFSAILGSGVPFAATDMTISDQSSYNAGGALPAGGTLAGLADETIGARVSLPGPGLQPTILVARGDVGATLFSANNQGLIGAALTAGTKDNILIGCESSGVGVMGGRVKALILSSTVYDSPQVLAVHAPLAAWAGVDLTITNDGNLANVVFDGASTTIGQGGDPLASYHTGSGGGYGFVEVCKDQLGRPRVSWHNVGISGNTAAQCLTAYTSGFTPNACFQPSTPKNIYIGPNESATNNNVKTGAEMYADYLTHLTAVKTQAWYKIATMLLPFAPGTTGYDYNILMRANAVANGIDLIDMSFFASDLAANFALYVWPDGHMKVFGHRYVANNFVLPYLRSVI